MSDFTLYCDNLRLKVITEFLDRESTNCCLIFFMMVVKIFYLNRQIRWPLHFHHEVGWKKKFSFNFLKRISNENDFLPLNFQMMIMKWKSFPLKNTETQNFVILYSLKLPLPIIMFIIFMMSRWSSLFDKHLNTIKLSGWEEEDEKWEDKKNLCSFLTFIRISVKLY